MKKTVTLDSGLTVEVDMNHAATPEATLELYKYDQEGDALAGIRFLTLALGAAQRDRLVASIQDADGNPGSWGDLSAAVRDLVKKLGEDGKKS